MTSFRKFLEIAINSEIRPPQIMGGSFPRKSSLHDEEGASQKIIPFVVHSDVGHEFTKHKRLDMWRQGVPSRFKPAMDVFDRLEDQIEKDLSVPDMLVTYISNVEAQSIRELGSEMVDESKSERARSFSSEVGRAAVDRWMSIGISLQKSVDNGINFLKLNSNKGE